MRAFVLLALVACGGGSDATDGGVTDAAHDARDAFAIDAPSEASFDGGRTPGNALQTGGACATASSSVELTNSELTIELWVRVDVAPADAALKPIVWTGGRSMTEPGWSFDISSAGLVFCIASTTTSKCTTPYPLAPSHLVHVAARSDFSAQLSNSRSVTIYARDVTAGDAAHALAGSLVNGPNAWVGAGPLAVGGDGACATNAAVTIDDLRIFTTIASVASLDTDESVDIACSGPSLDVDFKFDESSGTTTTDCTSTALALTLGSAAAFVPSPFP